MEKHGARPADGADGGGRRGVSNQRPRRRQRIRSSDLRKEFDAILLAGGAESPRDLHVPGRELKGIHFAMDFLPQQNKRVAGDQVPSQILATGKRVVIIGGGDTGADCLGTCHRQKAESVHQFEIMPMPPQERAPSTPWPLWPLQLRVESSHEEGGVRDWAIATTKFTGDEDGNVRQLHAHSRGRRRPNSSRCPGPNSPWMPTWCCSPWVSPGR